LQFERAVSGDTFAVLTGPMRVERGLMGVFGIYVTEQKYRFAVLNGPMNIILIRIRQMRPIINVLSFGLHVLFRTFIGPLCLFALNALHFSVECATIP